MLGTNGSSLKGFIERALPLYLSASDFAHEFEGHILRAREAGFYDTRFRLGLLGLWTAFEGLVRCLHKQLRQADSSDSERAFALVRKELCDEIQRRIAQSPDQEAIWRRFAGRITSVEFTAWKNRLMPWRNISSYLGEGKWSSPLTPGKRMAYIRASCGHKIFSTNLDLPERSTFFPPVLRFGLQRRFLDRSDVNWWL